MLSYMGKQWRRHTKERSLVNGEYAKASSLLAEKSVLEEQLTAVLGRMFCHRKGDPDSLDVAKRYALEQDIAEIDNKVAIIRQEKPEVAALLQYDEMQKRLHEHHNSGFMQFVSRQRLMNKLLKGLVSTKPAVLMLGESGVGKTAVARELGKAIGVDVIYSLPPGDTSEPVQRLLATKGWEGNKDVYRFGPLLQAMTGYETSEDMQHGKNRHSGCIFFDDEFNKRTSTQQALILKFVAAAKPGQEVDVPGTSLRVFVQPKFAYLAAGNPPSTRYERNETPLEAYREVSNRLLLDYLEQTPAQPELYEAMVAALLDEKTGRLRVVGENDVMPGYRKLPFQEKQVLETDPKECGVIWNFANAWKQTLLAFSHQPTEFHKLYPAAAPSTYHLDKIILDIGKVLQWLRDFKLDRRAQRRGIKCFLQEKLTDELEGQVHATDAEKRLFADYFRAHGILVERPSPNDYRPSQPSVLTPVQVGYLFPQVPRPGSKEKQKLESPKGKSALLPDGSEVRYEPEAYPVGRIIFVPGDSVKLKNGQEAVYVGSVEADANKRLLVRLADSQLNRVIEFSEIDGKATLALMKGISEVVEDPRLQEVKDIIEKGGGTFYGPQSLTAMGLKAPETLPPLPPRKVIERYAALGFDLRLQVSTTPDGKDLTFAMMNSMLQKKLDELPDTSPPAGRILYKDENRDSTKKLPQLFYSKARVSTCWAFTSGLKTRGCEHGLLKDPTRPQNYCRQAPNLINFIKQLMPKETLWQRGLRMIMRSRDAERDLLQSAVKERNVKATYYGAKRRELDPEDFSKEQNESVARLAINQLFRAEAQDVLFCFAQTFLNSPANQRERLIDNSVAWTNTRTERGNFVGIGAFIPTGANILTTAFNREFWSSWGSGIFLSRKFGVGQS